MKRLSHIHEELFQQIRLHGSQGCTAWLISGVAFENFPPIFPLQMALNMKHSVIESFKTRSEVLLLQTNVHVTLRPINLFTIKPEMLPRKKESPLFTRSSSWPEKPE